MSERYKYKRIAVGQYEVNCFLLYRNESKNCIIIDPGAEPERIIEEINNLNLEPKFIVLTHGHFDHCGAAKELCERFQIPVVLHEADMAVIHSETNTMMAETLGLTVPPEIKIQIDNEKFTIEGFEEIKILHTPGHSPGSVCLLVENLVFCGDTVFAGSIGRTDLPGGDFNQIKKSLEKIKKLPIKVLLFPGHGNETSLDTELKFNPFF